MDNKAKKILFQTYWSGKGWKAGADRYTSPEDFAYAKEKGLMFTIVEGFGATTLFGIAYTTLSWEQSM